MMHLCICDKNQKNSSDKGDFYLDETFILFC